MNDTSTSMHSRKSSFGRMLLVVALAASAAGACKAQAQETPSSAIAKSYACPMHADVRSKDPGVCPKCHMDLEEVQPSKAPAPKLAQADAEH